MEDFQEDKKMTLERMISRFPRDVIYCIISRLPLKQALILYPQWKNLWKIYTKLDFDSIVWEKRKKHKPSKTRSAFIDWVNQVIQSFDGPVIEEFKLRFGFDLNQTCFRHITNWIDFVNKKKVQRLELDFLETRSSFGDRGKILSFSNIYSSLKSLTLKGINISPNESVKRWSRSRLEDFLSCCPLLESLCLEKVGKFSSLDTQRCPLLKYLKIWDCEVKIVTVSSPNLVSFDYFGSSTTVDLQILHAPLLTSVSLFVPSASALEPCEEFGSVISPFLSYLSQLQNLKLDYDVTSFQHLPEWEFPMMNNLRHLRWGVLSCLDTSIIGLYSMLRACPSLHTLTLETFWRGNDYNADPMQMDEYQHQSLKVVKLVGFSGNMNEVHFILFILENVIMLEKIIMDSSSKVVESENLEELQRRKEQAQQLIKMKLHPITKLVIF